MAKIFLTKPYEYQSKIIYEAIEHLKEKGFYPYLLKIGLGKTLCSLYTALKLYQQNLCNGIIIVPPKMLVNVWLNEIKKHTNIDHTLFIWDNLKKINKKYKYELSKFLDSYKFKIFIVNIESFQLNNTCLFKIFEDSNFTRNKLLIIDESGKIKNHKAARTKNLIKHTESVTFKTLLTGTEISNSVLDLFSQFEFLKYDFWGIYKKTLSQRFYTYRAKYMILKDMQIANGKTFSIPVAVKPNKLQEINNRIYTPVLKELKQNCPIELPDKIYQEVEIEPNWDQIKIYNDLKEKLWTEYKNQELTVTTKIALYTRFRQIASGFMPESNLLIGKKNKKVEFIIADSEELNEKIVIWSAFKPALEYIEKELNAYFKNKVCCTLHGGQTINERKKILIDFENNVDIKYLIANQATASYGLNLQFCRLNYYFANHLSPDFREQSEGRTYRNGQSNHPIYKDLLFKGTLEKRILQNLKYKKDLLKEFQEMDLVKFIEEL